MVLKRNLKGDINIQLTSLLYLGIRLVVSMGITLANTKMSIKYLSTSGYQIVKWIIFIVIG